MVVDGFFRLFQFIFKYLFFFFRKLAQRSILGVVISCG